MASAMPDEFSNPAYVNPGGVAESTAAAVITVANAAARTALLAANAQGRIVKQAGDFSVWCLKPNGSPSVSADWELIGYYTIGTLASQSANNIAVTGGTINGVSLGGNVTFADAAATRNALGLGNVNNTSDANKPVSTPQAQAIGTAKSEAIQAAATDATTKSNNAQAAAIQAAATDATTKANNAYQAAVQAAATDATTKSNNAQAAAIQAAATDATAKAGTAQTAAIQAAATDATTKANNALAAAKQYTDENAGGGSGSVPVHRHSQYHVVGLHDELAAKLEVPIGLAVSGTLSPDASGGLLPCPGYLEATYPEGRSWSSDGLAVPAATGVWIRLYRFLLLTRSAGTLNALAPPEGYTASDSQSTATRISVQSAAYPAFGAWTIYWLYDDGVGIPRWVNAADSGMADAGGDSIPAGRVVSSISSPHPPFSGGLLQQWYEAHDALFAYVLEHRTNGASPKYWYGKGSSAAAITDWSAGSGASGTPVVVVSVRRIILKTCADDAAAAEEGLAIGTCYFDGSVVRSRIGEMIAEGEPSNPEISFYVTGISDTNITTEPFSVSSPVGGKDSFVNLNGYGAWYQSDRWTIIDTVENILYSANPGNEQYPWLASGWSGSGGTPTLTQSYVLTPPFPPLRVSGDKLHVYSASMGRWMSLQLAELAPGM